MPRTDDDRLQECWRDALAQWETAVNISMTERDASRSQQVRRKKRGWPFWPGFNIAITGEEGAGKTVLAKALISVIDPSIDASRLPRRSRKSEYYRYFQRTPGQRMRIQLTVIPGQVSDARRQAEAIAFGPRPVKTLIHTACWGRNKSWDYGARLVTVERIQARTPEVDLESIFTEYKQRELDNFIRISDLLQTAWQDQHDVWLIIAVTMCDLFKDRLDEARDYFIPTSAKLRAEAARAIADAAIKAAEEAESAAKEHTGHGELSDRAAELWANASHADEVAKLAEKACSDPAKTGFANALEDLVRSVNVSRFSKLAVLPVSAVHVERGQFGVDVHESSQMEPPEISQMLDHFVAKVGEFCASEKEGSYGP